MSVVKRTYQISFVYEVEVDEENLLHDYAQRSPEDVEQAKRLLHAALNDPAAEDFLMMNEIGAHMADVGFDMTNILSGLEEGDYTPIANVLKTLSEEDREQLMEYDGGDGAYQILMDALKAKLDHVHVHKLQEHTHNHQQQLAPQDQGSAPTRNKQRHHKRKTGR